MPGYTTLLAPGCLICPFLLPQCSAWSFDTRSLPSSCRNPLATGTQRSSWTAVYARYNDQEYSEGDDDLPTDWVQAELTLLNAPTEPSPDLDPETIALAVCRSLQWVDYPTKSAGLEWCFDFFTFECRKAVTARQGGQTVERFCEYGILSPALQPFMGATRVELGTATFTPAQPPYRGAITSFPVVITGASLLSVQYPSGFDRSGIAAEPPTTHMVLRLEQQRRPPGQGCWFVKEVMDVRYAFAGDMGNAHVGG